jgi:Ca2+-binding RTX toxin-like protein
VLKGLGGDDRLHGKDGNDELSGGDGDDRLEGGAGADTMDGGVGIDTLDYADSTAGVTVSLLLRTASGGDAHGDSFSGIENVDGSRFADHLQGDDVRNVLWGDAGNDTLVGMGGDDLLLGSDGDDHLYGGPGRDALYGGADADRFSWSFTSDTGLTRATADEIWDFNAADGDRIDLAAIDADVTAAGNQAFTFVGGSAFSGAPGEVNYYWFGGNTYIQMNTGGNGDPEGVIRLDGIHTPEASWFVL